MRWRRTISLTSDCLAVLLLLSATLANAQDGNRLSVLLDVDTDGSAVVVEKLELASPISNAITWRMPTASATSLGVRRLLFLDVLEISDGNGNHIASHTRRHADVLDVIIPVQPLAGNAVKITYEVRNAVRFRDDRDEFAWTVGRAWSEPIHHVEVNVAVPDAAAGQMTAQIVRGKSNAPPAQAIPMNGTKGSAAVEGPWPADRQPIVDLVFAPGVLQQPSFGRRAAWFLAANPIVLLPVLLLLVGVAFRRYSNRGLSADISVAPRYSPPGDLPPAEAGYIADGRLDPRDVAAMLLDLARRGFIRIEAGEPDPGVPYAGPDFVLRLVKPMDNWAGGYSYEHTMLFHTFYGGHWTKLSSLSLRFYAVVPTLEQMIRDELQGKQLYVDPRRVAALRLLAAVVLIAVLVAVQSLGWFAVAQSWLLFAVVAVSLVPIALLFKRGVPHLTAKGVRVFSELRGFEEFLNSVEADRMERVTPDLFEQFLPYAIALGVEHNWGTAFSTISSGPPLWWDAAKAGGLPDFVHLVGSFSHAPPRRGPSRVAPPPESHHAASAPSSGPQTSS